MTTPPPPPPMSFVPANGQAKNWMGVTALVTGIVGLVGACCYGIGALPAIAGIVFGALAKKAVDEGQATNPGMGKAGLILGICGVVVSIGYVIVIVVIIAADASSGY